MIACKLAAIKKYSILYSMRITIRTTVRIRKDTEDNHQLPRSSIDLRGFFGIQLQNGFSRHVLFLGYFMQTEWCIREGKKHR